MLFIGCVVFSSVFCCCCVCLFVCLFSGISKHTFETMQANFAKSQLNYIVAEAKEM